MRFNGLDFVRALAISSVFLCHVMAISDMHGRIVGIFGDAGVDLFFALSGMLIGRILIPLSNTPGGMVWVRFMSRRWLRTIPAYLVVLVTLYSVTDADEKTFIRHLLMLQGWSSADYAAQWFGVSWSLAVEEWFYLSFSSVLFVAASMSKRDLDNRKIAIFIAFMFILLPLAARMMIGYPNGFGYLPRLHHDPLLRVDEIAWGVLGAWVSLYVKVPSNFAPMLVSGLIMFVSALLIPINAFTPTLRT